jgi:hypothetical protein
MPALQPDPVAMLSRREVARRWGVSVDTVRRREQEGLLVAMRFNARLLRYRRDQVEAIERHLLGLGNDEPEREYPAHATWRNRDHDQPVVITGVMGIDEDSGETYFAGEGGTGIPESELVFDA